MTGTGIFREHGAPDGRVEIPNDTHTERDDVFTFEVVRVSDQVAFVSHVQEVRCAECFPEPVLHPFDRVDEFSDFQDAEACGVQDGFPLGEVCTLLGSLAVSDGLGRPTQQAGECDLKALQRLAAFFSRQRRVRILSATVVRLAATALSTALNRSIIHGRLAPSPCSLANNFC